MTDLRACCQHIQGGNNLPRAGRKQSCHCGRGSLQSCADEAYKRPWPVPVGMHTADSVILAGLLAASQCG